MTKTLPQGLRAKAFIATNGETAWRRDDVPAVLNAYRNANVAVEAFEVWVVNDRGQWTGFFPTKAGGEAICVYDVDPRANETAEEFAHRCAKELLHKIQEVDIESQIREDLVPHIRYNLHVAEEYASEPPAGGDAEDRTPQR
jgi:hypothetical protein